MDRGSLHASKMQVTEKIGSSRSLGRPTAQEGRRILYMKEKRMFNDTERRKEERERREEGGKHFYQRNQGSEHFCRVPKDTSSRLPRIVRYLWGKERTATWLYTMESRLLLEQQDYPHWCTTTDITGWWVTLTFLFNDGTKRRCEKHYMQCSTEQRKSTYTWSMPVDLRLPCCSKMTLIYKPIRITMGKHNGSMKNPTLEKWRTQIFAIHSALKPRYSSILSFRKHVSQKSIRTVWLLDD